MALALDPRLSLFEIVAQQQRRHLFATLRGSMTILSHEIEDTVISGQIYARVFAGFQRFSYFEEQADRYRRMARFTERVFVFGYPDVRPPVIKNVDFIELSQNDALYREWFLIADSPSYFSALLAQDMTGFGVPAGERRFKGLWTFDAQLVRQLQEAASLSLGVEAPQFSVQPRDYVNQLQQIGFTVENLIQSLESRNADLVRAQSLRRELTEILVHDLRNPLTAVNGYLDLLERALRDGKQQAVEQFLQGARENTEDLLHMITDILDISRLEAGEFRFEQEPVALASIFAATQHRFESLARLEGKRITAQALPDVGVYGDHDVLLRVLVNLISNAFKHTARREGKIQLTAVTDAALDQTVITVTDNGVGIPTDMHEKIFEKFVQVPESGDRRGFGLGLAFCKMAVEALGGTLTVRSQVGQGSTFRIALRTAPIITKSRIELS